MSHDNYEDSYSSAHHEPSHHEESAHAEPPHSTRAKKFFSVLGIAIAIALAIGFVLNNFPTSKHGSAMQKVEQINSKNLELIDQRAALRITRDTAKTQMDTANVDIKKIEEQIRKNKAEAATLLKAIYE